MTCTFNFLNFIKIFKKTYSFLENLFLNFFTNKKIINKTQR